MLDCLCQHGAGMGEDGRIHLNSFEKLKSLFRLVSIELARNESK